MKWTKCIVAIIFAGLFLTLGHHHIESDLHESVECHVCQTAQTITSPSDSITVRYADSVSVLFTVITPRFSESAYLGYHRSRAPPILS